MPGGGGGLVDISNGNTGLRTATGIVSSFKYLGHLLTEDDEYWPSAIDNIWKTRKNWYLLYWILVQEGVYTRALGRFYVAIFQAVFMFGSETWVLITHIRRLLGDFHRSVDKQILDNLPQKWADGTWE